MSVNLKDGTDERQRQCENPVGGLAQRNMVRESYIRRALSCSLISGGSCGSWGSCGFRIRCFVLNVRFINEFQKCFGFYVQLLVCID